MTALSATIAAAVGLAVGSFVNVVALRVPAGGSVVHPGSHCPDCSHPIEPRDNIPVVSYVLLRGRCRHCGGRISLRYPLVEATTAVLFAAAVRAIGVVWVLPAYLWFIGLTVALTVTDIDRKLIPNRILYPGTLVAAGLLIVGSTIDGDVEQLPGAGIGALAYFGALFLLALVARGGFGFGDVKLGLLLGMFLGYQRLGFVAAGGVLAFVGGGAVSLFLIVTRLRGRKDAIPFGPYMVVAAYVTLAFGDEIIDWWLP